MENFWSLVEESIFVWIGNYSQPNIQTENVILWNGSIRLFGSGI